ncbi:MAG: ABC transporter substrate-binding protein, partial [Clostridia bacterium]|nr:ABC transporter substrate-binding protein [Clostridia bacterium]
MKKRVVSILLAICLCLGMTAACAEALSGKVTVYMPSPAGLANKLAALFTEKTGVAVEQFQGTTGEILARLEAEQAN